MYRGMVVQLYGYRALLGALIHGYALSTATLVIHEYSM